MNSSERKAHWEDIYQTKKPDEVSWYQPVPQTSLNLIEKLQTDKEARILDVGGGDSYLSDYLLKAGYGNLSVLDISSEALARAAKRHGEHARQIEYFQADIIDYQPAHKIDIWHDRAALHFLTSDEEVSKYTDIIMESISPGGYVIIGVFSDEGPTKCSGIEIRQYNEESMLGLLGDGFDVVETFRSDHKTPFDTQQNFIFSVYRRRV